MGTGSGTVFPVREQQLGHSDWLLMVQLAIFRSFLQCREKLQFLRFDGVFGWGMHYLRSSESMYFMSF